MTNLTPSLPISEANSAVLLQTLTAGKTRRSTENRLAYYKPYAKQREFIGNSSEPFMATGSTTAGVYKLGYDGNLYSINLATGASTLIGPTGLPLNGTCCGNGFIGMSANGSSLYINQNDSLYLIDTMTGHASLISSTSPAIFTQTLSIDGILYGASDTGLGGGGREIFTFDPNTDTVTAGPFTNSPRSGDWPWSLAQSSAPDCPP